MITDERLEELAVHFEREAHQSSRRDTAAALRELQQVRAQQGPTREQIEAIVEPKMAPGISERYIAGFRSCRNAVLALYPPVDTRTPPTQEEA